MLEVPYLVSRQFTSQKGSVVIEKFLYIFFLTDRSSFPLMVSFGGEVLSSECPPGVVKPCHVSCLNHEGKVGCVNGG